MIDQMSDGDKEQLGRGHCPDCGYRGFVLGPRGGVAINIECGNMECRARFNVTPYAGTMLFAERIPRERDGGARWPSEQFTGNFS